MILIALLTESSISSKYVTLTNGGVVYCAQIDQSICSASVFDITLSGIDGNYKCPTLSCEFGSVAQWRLALNCISGIQYKEELREYPSATSCVDITDATVCGYSGLHTLAYTLRAVDEVEICAAVDASRVITEGSCGDKRFELGGDNRSYISDDINVTLELAEYADLTSYKTVIVRHGQIFGVPDFLENRTQLNVDDYIYARTKDLTAPLHQFSVISGIAHPDYYEEIIKNSIGGVESDENESNSECSVTAVDSQQAVFACAAKQMQSTLLFNATGVVDMREPQEITEDAIKDAKCQLIRHVGASLDYIRCEYTVNGVYEAKESVRLCKTFQPIILSAYETAKEDLLSQNEDVQSVDGEEGMNTEECNLVTELAVDELVDVERPIEIVFSVGVEEENPKYHVIGLEKNVPVAVLALYQNTTFKSTFCPPFCVRINETYCNTGCYNDTIWDGKVCQRKKCPIDYEFYEDEQRCVTYTEYAALTGIVLPSQIQFFANYECGEHGEAQDGMYKCKCEEGFQCIDRNAEIMCSECPAIEYPDIPKMGFGELLASFFDGGGSYAFGRFGVLGEWFDALKQVFKNKIIVVLLAASVITGVIAASTKAMTI